MNSVGSIITYACALSQCNVAQVNFGLLVLYELPGTSEARMSSCTFCAGRGAATGYACCGRTCAAALKIAGRQFIMIVNPASGLVLDINQEHGAVQLWHYNGGSNQLWQYDLATRAIFNTSSGMALDIDAEDGMSLTIWQRNQTLGAEHTLNPGIPGAEGLKKRQMRVIGFEREMVGTAKKTALSVSHRCRIERQGPPPRLRQIIHCRIHQPQVIHIAANRRPWQSFKTNQTAGKTKEMAITRPPHLPAAPLARLVRFLDGPERVAPPWNA